MADDGSEVHAFGVAADKGFGENYELNALDGCLGGALLEFGKGSSGIEKNRSP